VGRLAYRFPFVDVANQLNVLFGYC
jgi:hypothetical protein